MRQLTPRPRGLTLIELMVGIGIGAFLLAVGAPMFTDYIANSRLREGGHTLYTEALIAQSEAIKRNTTIRLSTNGASVQVIDRTDPANPVVLRQQTLAGNVAIEVDTLDFGGEGRPSPFGTAFAVDLSTPAAACSNEIRCPGLRIDAGGAIRLCPNHAVNCN